MEGLDAIFYPRSIAVVGASRETGSVGQSVLANLIGSRFKGVVFPINPKATSILGIKAYARILDVPDEVDLAVIVVPSQGVPLVLEECGQAGVKGAIIITAGFKEIGLPGVELEVQVQEIARRHQMSLVGPNCLGVINTDPLSSMNATFGTQMPRPGNVALISQSGALCVAVLDYAKEANIGFSKFISMGNKAGVNENELLQYLKSDPKTDVILMYLEDLVQGREFMTIAREITSSRQRPKPILALKAGRTLVGAHAASSHTGSLAGSDRVYDAVFEQSGVLRVDTLEELFDYVKAFASQPLPKGRNVAIITNSGGPGILATDSCIEHNLNVVPLGRATKKRLRRILSATASLQNPIDLVAEAQAEQYEGALRAVLSDRRIHSAIVILTPTAFTQVENIASVIVQVARSSRRPILCCFLGIYDVSKGVRMLEENGIPNFRFPESAARVLAEMTNFTSWLKRPQTGIKTYRVQKRKARAVIEWVRRQGRHCLLEPEAFAVLKAYHFPVVRSILARSEAQAVEAAEKLGFPVVMKIVSPDILHKFDYGGVKLGLKSKSDVKRAYQEISIKVRKAKPEARIVGMMVEEMVAQGQEVILGMNRDAQFGPILMFGMGGIYVEALEDVSFRLAPIREYSALAMIRKTRTHKILDGFRGGPVYDIQAITDCLKRLSQLVVDFEEIQELDINPLIVFEKGKGAKIVDARIILAQPSD